MAVLLRKMSRQAKVKIPRSQVYYWDVDFAAGCAELAF